MQTFDHLDTDAIATEIRPTFEERIGSLDLPVIPRNTVRRHMRNIGYEGDGDPSWPNLLIDEVLAWISLYRIGVFIVNRRNGYAFGLVAALAVAVFVMFDGVAPWVHLLVAMILSLNFVGYLSGMGWRDTRDIDAFRVPPLIRERVAMLDWAGIKWFVAYETETFSQLLFATEGKWFWRKDVCVGSWNRINQKVDVI